MKLSDVNVSELEMRRGWLGSGRDKAEDDPSWHRFRLGRTCRNCEGIGYTEGAAFMCLDGQRPDPCPACNGSGRA